MFGVVFLKHPGAASIYVPGLAAHDVIAPFSAVQNSDSLEPGEVVSCTLRRNGSRLEAEKVTVLAGEKEKAARRRLQPLFERDRGWQQVKRR